MLKALSAQSLCKEATIHPPTLPPEQKALASPPGVGGGVFVFGARGKSRAAPTFRPGVRGAHMQDNGMFSLPLPHSGQPLQTLVTSRNAWGGRGGGRPLPQQEHQKEAQSPHQPVSPLPSTEPGGGGQKVMIQEDMSPFLKSCIPCINPPSPSRNPEGAGGSPDAASSSCS